MDWIRQESSREELSLLNVVAHTKSVVLLENVFNFFNNSVYLSSTCFIQRVFKFHFYFFNNKAFSNVFYSWSQRFPYIYEGHQPTS